MRGMKVMTLILIIGAIIFGVIGFTFAIAADNINDILVGFFVMVMCGFLVFGVLMPLMDALEKRRRF